MKRQRFDEKAAQAVMQESFEELQRLQHRFSQRLGRVVRELEALPAYKRGLKRSDHTSHSGELAEWLAYDCRQTLGNLNNAASDLGEHLRTTKAEAKEHARRREARQRLERKATRQLPPALGYRQQVSEIIGKLGDAQKEIAATLTSVIADVTPAKARARLRRLTRIQRECVKVHGLVARGLVAPR